MADTSQSFTTLSYNIDNLSANREERLKILLSLIDQYKPDLVALQEVTIHTCDKLTRAALDKGYKRFLPMESRDRNEYEMIWYKTDFPNADNLMTTFQRTDQNRGVTQVTVRINEYTIIFTTSQFEKGNRSRVYRKNQIGFLKTFERQDNPVIFCCDTGILTYESQSDLSGWIDAWYAVGDSESKYTYDSSTNMLTPRPFRDRTDRVWYYPGRLMNGEKLECISYELIGKGSGASSHYGLLCKWKVTVNY